MTEIVAESVRRSLAEHYAKGFKDGVRETLNQLEGRSDNAPGGAYLGTMPPELHIWIAAVRERLDD